jgi:hypothetical protein
MHSGPGILFSGPDLLGHLGVVPFFQLPEDERLSLRCWQGVQRCDDPPDESWIRDALGKIGGDGRERSRSIR